MNQSDIPKLVAAILEDGLSDEQFAALEQLLAADPVARESYRHQLQIHTLLMYGTHPTHRDNTNSGSATGADPGNEFANFVRESSGKSTWEVELYKKATETFSACRNDANDFGFSTSDDPEISMNPLLSSLGSASPNLSNSAPPPLAGTDDSPLHNPAGSPSVLSNWLANHSRLLIFSFLAVIMLGVGFAETWIRFRSPAQITAATPLPAQPIIEQSAKTSPIAVLVSANGCDLNVPTAHKNFVEGDGVLLGEEVTLREGIADFRLSSTGVLLSIEGPASFVITSNNSLVLRQGKLTAHVPWAATNFHLMAGPYRLTTFDSEFGVNVRGTSTSVHVFSGEITCLSSPFSERRADEVEPNDMEEPSSTAPNSMITISSGKAVELSLESHGDTTINHHAADASQFASRMSMAGHLQIDSNYINEVKKSRPIGYWRFEEVKNDAIQNEVDSENPLRVTTELTLRGDKANHFLDLGHGFAGGNLVSVKTMDALSKENFSVEMWFKPSHYHRGFLMALAEQLDSPVKTLTNLQNDIKGIQYERNGFRLELQRDFGIRVPGTIACAFRYPLGVTSLRAYSNELYHLRRWQHLVVVKGKFALIMYLDGKAVAYVKGSTQIPNNMHVVVGRPFPSFNDYPYYGQLDELAIYSRVMTSEEVIKHFKAGEEANRPKTGI